MNRFDPPGFLDDLSEAQKDAVERRSSPAGSIVPAPGSPAEMTARGASSSMPLTNPPADDAQVAVISWNAFPRQVKAHFAER